MQSILIFKNNTVILKIINIHIFTKTSISKELFSGNNYNLNFFMSIGILKIILSQSGQVGLNSPVSKYNDLTSFFIIFFCRFSIDLEYFTTSINVCWWVFLNNEKIFRYVLHATILMYLFQNAHVHFFLCTQKQC